MAGISQSHHRASVRDLNILTIPAFTSSECVEEQGTIWKKISTAVINRSSARPKNIRRIWKTSGSKFNWFFLFGSLGILGRIVLIYRSALATQLYPGPYNNPFRQFGIVAFILVLLAKL